MDTNVCAVSIVICVVLKNNELYFSTFCYESVDIRLAVAIEYSSRSF